MSIETYIFIFCPTCALFRKIQVLLIHGTSDTLLHKLASYRIVALEQGPVVLGAMVVVSVVDNILLGETLVDSSLVIIVSSTLVAPSVFIPIVVDGISLVGIVMMVLSAGIVFVSAVKTIVVTEGVLVS